jgi:hypothetical protein
VVAVRADPTLAQAVRDLVVTILRSVRRRSELPGWVLAILARLGV